MKIIDLKGLWKYQTDENDEGIAKGYFASPLVHNGFALPGSACENHVGDEPIVPHEMTKESLRSVRERYEYVGALWLQREIEIPKEWEGKAITLYLERVNIASELWIDEEKIDRQIIEISAPHIYRLTDRLTSGKHTLTLRLDNRDLLNISDMASGFSVDTQGHWIGIIGKIELRCEEIYHLENIQVYPDENGIDVKMSVMSDVRAPHDRVRAKVELTVISPDDKPMQICCHDIVLYNSRQVVRFRYDIENPLLWDEFEQPLYHLNVKLVHAETVDEKSVRFGMRTIKIHNKKLKLNGKPLFLRGTVDSSQFPMTGYPPTDIEHWRSYFKTMKSYGLNHVRFHAWCPPESMFAAADELGVYILAEMPLWLNVDVCPYECGADPIHKYYFANEALTISKTYGNHPSFIMFSNGNENMGDFEMLEDITTQIKAYDNRRLYTMTSNFYHPASPCEDYISAFEAEGHRVRLQTFGNEIAESSYVDYKAAVDSVDVPIVSFEVGQHCVYPDVDITEKYQGNMRAVNFEIIKENMIKTGNYHKLKKYIKASGALSFKMYKEEIETAMRTNGFGGFELLSLYDYTGQSVATVGMLDIFMDSKGICTPAEFSQFCNAVVPLFKSKRIYKNSDVLVGELDLFDFGKNKITDIEYNVKIYNGNELFYSVKTNENRIEVPLSGVEKSAMLRVTVEVSGYENEWRIFVMSDCSYENNIQIMDGNSPKLDEIIENGGKAIVTGKNLAKRCRGSFYPTFWSPAYFSPRRGCGLMINSAHKIFENFPTEDYADFQWKNPIEHAMLAEISVFGKDFEPIVEAVPNFVDNTPRSALFEAKVGKADILYCGFDLDGKDIASKQLASSILAYASSAEFAPKQHIDKELFKKLF